jgi:3-dehydroquinate synthase
MSKPMACEVVHVSVPSRTYDVTIGRGILDQVGLLTRATCNATRACVISDSNVSPLYSDVVIDSLGKAGMEPHLLTFPAGERSKGIRTYSDLLEGLAKAGLTRDDVVVALGGGVTGDLAGFAAATYMRGCAVVQVPTSLLAMVDSSVGGKTAIDLSAGKNLAGAFFQPSAVIADVDCLRTIDPLLFADSCGEVIKHGVLADPSLFERLEERPLTDEGPGDDDLIGVVRRNVEIKRDIVDADEREGGVRQTLNLGHTIGHAIEAASDFKIGHGSCVAAGLCCMARACVAKGICDEEVAERIEHVVAAHGLPTDTDLDHELLLELAGSDKKRHGDTLNIVVPLSIGHVEVRKVDLPELGELIDLGCGVASDGR